MPDRTDTTNKIARWGLIVVLIVVRFIYLDRTPLFADEAHHCYLGYQIRLQGWREFWQNTIFVYKDAPLLPLLNGLALFIPGISAVDACRGVVVLTSGIGTWLFWKLTRNIWVLLFYLLNPFSAFADRTSMMEPVLVTMVLFYCWSVINKRRVLAIMAIGLMFAAKQSAILALPIPFLWQLEKTKKSIWLIGSGVLLALFLKRVTPLWDTASMHATFIFDLERTKQNLWLIGSWLVQYLEWPGITVLVLGGLLSGWRKRVGLIIIFMVIGGVYAVAGYTLFPRYLLMLVPFMAILVGEVAQFRWGKIVIALVLLLFMHKDWVILTAPEKAVIAKEDHYQYWEDWSSGLGTRETIKYLRDNNFSGWVWVPKDIMGLWVVTQLSYAQTRQWKEKFYTEAAEIGNEGLLINTSHHNFKQGKLLFASNGDHRNSIKIEELR